MLDNNLENLIQRAVQQSASESIDMVYPEMVLLFLLDDPDVIKVIHKIRGSSSQETIAAIHSEIKSYLMNESYIPRSNVPSSKIFISPILNECLTKSVMMAQSSQKISAVDSLLLLQNMYTNPDIFGVTVFENNGLEQRAIVAAIKFIRENPSFNQNDASSEEVADGEGDGSSEKTKQTDFEKYCPLLNVEVVEGRLDPLIGRQNEIEEVITALSRRKKNNPVLVGEAGVGKTALAEGLATKIVNKEVPDIIADANVYSLDMGAIIAGSKFRGDVEERIELVMKTLVKEYEDGGCPILFIDEIHMIVGAGASGNSSMDVSNLIKPILTKGSVRFFGATTQKEFRSIFEKDNALARRFQKVEVLEPSINDTIKILHGVKGAFEEHHGISYSDESIVSAVELSARHIHERQLPDKAIDILDIVGASQHIKEKAQRVDIITVKEIEEQIARTTKIPVAKVQSEEKAKLIDLEATLKTSIFGQDGAIKAVSDVIKISKAKLRKNNKPIGSFMFVGPTGVGKTELTNQVANVLDMSIVRLDMSEYKEPQSVSRLIGSPPGYVSHDEGGQLTEQVRKNPHCIVLLDEIEKAHSNVHEMFLQIMDNGKLTDAQGNLIDFTSTLIIMTSNAGASDLSKRGIGFGASEGKAEKSDVMVKVAEAFSPEFINRLDSVVQFKQLEKEHIVYVVDKFLNELDNILAESHGFTLQVSVDAKTWLAENGYDARMGARPMSRLILQQIEQKAAHLILENDGETELTLVVEVNEAGDGLAVDLTKLD